MIKEFITKVNLIERFCRFSTSRDIKIGVPAFVLAMGVWSLLGVNPGRTMTDPSGPIPSTSVASPSRGEAGARGSVGLASSPASASATLTAVSPDAEEMVLIPAGEFRMGANDGIDGERVVHTVYVDAFSMDKHEVTNRRFARFVRATGYRTESERIGGDLRPGVGLTWRHPFGPLDTLKGKGDWPVVYVTWNDAVAFCTWAGKRLPTEAEWEKAARGGLEAMKYPWGNEAPEGRACFGLDFENGRPMRVGSYEPNRYGLFDMAGNVGEWCSDWYGKDYYKISPSRSPVGPPTGKYRVSRGGAWGGPPNGVNLLCANRSFGYPTTFTFFFGFRCVRSVRHE